MGVKHSIDLQQHLGRILEYLRSCVENTFVVSITGLEIDSAHSFLTSDDHHRFGRSRIHRSEDQSPGDRGEIEDIILQLAYRDNKVVLNWKSFNSSGCRMVIERKVGDDISVIGGFREDELKYKPCHFEFADLHPIDGLSHYRIQQLGPYGITANSDWKPFYGNQGDLEIDTRLEVEDHNLIVETQLPEKGYLEFTLMDEGGKIHYNHAEYREPGDVTKIIDIASIPGSYAVLRVALNGKSHQMRIKLPTD